MGEVIERFPVFPLGLVLLPSEALPLHIFEERYKAMIGECLERESDFGVLWLSDDGLRQVGCTAQITEVLERADDGRLNILVEGSRPFRLRSDLDDAPYPAGAVELLEEPVSGPVDPEVAAEARERYADLVERATDTRPSGDDLAATDAYGMAATVDLALEPKQALLELRSEEQRLRTVAELLEQTMKRLDHAERVGELARSNGKLGL